MPFLREVDPIHFLYFKVQTFSALMDVSDNVHGGSFKKFQFIGEIETELKNTLATLLYIRAWLR